MVLSKEELERYNRQIIFKKWGVKGQEKLKASMVTIMGVGGLGCPVSLYLAAAGVGTIVLVDEGSFELSNLNRQILGWTKDVGRLKTECTSEKLKALNPNIDVITISERIDKKNAEKLASLSDVFIDALDNWNTRFLLNRVCVENKKPLIHAGVNGMYGQVMTILPGKGPCLRCFLPENIPETPIFPVIGATPGLFAMLQAFETFKILLRFGRPLIGRMLIFNGEDADFHIVKIKRSPKCIICGDMK